MIPTHFIAALALAASLPFSAFAGLSVTFTEPNSSTKWNAGSKYTVQWKVAGQTFAKGDLYLAHDGVIDYTQHLAGAFNVSSGKVGVKAPEVSKGEYEIAMVASSMTIGYSSGFTILDS